MRLKSIISSCSLHRRRFLPNALPNPSAVSRALKRADEEAEAIRREETSPLSKYLANVIVFGG